MRYAYLKPIIGVMPLWDDERESIWMLPGYMDGLVQAGAVPIILPLTGNEDDVYQIMNMCDGILFTGGQDVSPNIYHEDALEGIVSCCRQRDVMELIVLKQAIKEDKPVLGICRGIQFINSALGGTLYQDLMLQHPSNINHHQSPPYDEPVHKVSIVENTPLNDCLGKNEILVNSYHHQAIKELSPKLKEMAISSDGLVEAVYMPESKFLWAVQWHPEFSFKVDENSQKIFRAFVNSIKMSDR